MEERNTEWIGERKGVVVLVPSFKGEIWPTPLRFFTRFLETLAKVRLGENV